MRTFLGLVLLLFLAAGAVFVDALRLLDRPLALREETNLLIPEGQAFAAIVDGMAANGWLSSAPRSGLYLRLYARMTGLATQVKAGEYQLTPGLSARGALALFVSGKTVLHELRLIEGWTFRQALEAVRRHPQLRQTLGDAEPEWIMSQLGRGDLHPEGRLFPDTYRFPRDTTDLSVLRRAMDTMDRVLAEEWAQRSDGLPYATAEEALIMASIIEKETGVPHERNEIAGVFVRRLRLGMRLQTDPTVIYGIGESFDGNIRRHDLRTDTPYNTYTRAGLTPSPICLPGRASIRAALHPAEGRALFFVSRGDGTHEFSETLEQHNAAVRKYQLKR